MISEIQLLDGGVASVELGDIINTGSNSRLYKVLSYNNKHIKDLVAKCSKVSENFISFHLQFLSYVKCRNAVFMDCVLPKVISYGTSEGIGEILIMEHLADICEIHSLLVNQSEARFDCTAKLAEALSAMHDLGISGYDTEFYLNTDNALIILDIGPPETVTLSAAEMLIKHWDMEVNNIVGKWNIISQLMPKKRAKEIYMHRQISSVRINDVLPYIEEASAKLHLINVARTHSLSIIVHQDENNRNRLLEIFKEHYTQNMSPNKTLYLEAFEEAVSSKIQEAEARLYYSTVDTLSEVSCKVCINHQ